MRQDSVSATASSTPIRIPRWAYPLVTVASLLLGAEAVVRGTRTVVTAADSDLTNFFLPSANYILHGQPWQMYAVRASGLYPNYNPPLSMVIYAPLLALAQKLGLAGNLGSLITFVSLPLLVLVPLLGYLVVVAIRRLYPAAPDTLRFLAYVAVVLSPLTWQSIGSWYHLEQPMMLCLLVGALLALQGRREGLAGALAGLALLTRTTALFPLIALGVLLLCERRWRSLAFFGGVAAAVAAIGMAPFFLFDRADTVYSFLTWRGTAQIGGNSVWSVFACGNCTGGIRYTLDAAARRLDSPVVLLFVLATAGLGGLRLRISAYGRDAWAVMAVAALAVPMLSKTNWPYYYLEPFIFLLVWEFASMHDRVAGVWRWPVLTFAYLGVTATLSQFMGLQSVGALDRVLLGLLEFGFMLAFAVAVWARVRAAKPGGMAAQSAGGGGGGARGAEAALAGAAPVGMGHMPVAPGSQQPQGGQPLWPPAPQQPQHGQPQHGQPQHGQPQHGQPQHGQPQHGQPQHGQPQHGQPQHGQPQHGQPQHGQPMQGAAGSRPAPPMSQGWVVSPQPAAPSVPPYAPPPSAPLNPGQTTGNSVLGDDWPDLSKGWPPQQPSGPRGNR
ncbi:MAG: Cell division protein FtsH [Ktedonobacterales bacterium]|nr:MAG: Cell division protein FtsH [Ktedonobacterales bacterium]